MNTVYLHNQLRSWILLMTIILSQSLSACGLIPTASATELATATESPTLTPEPTSTLTATVEPTVTFTPSPTPVPLQYITRSNAAQIEKIYQMGLGTIRSSAWSPDGQMLVMVSSVGLYVYDMRAFWNDKKTLTLTKFIEYPDLNIVTFSPDGQLFATGTRGGSVQIWNVDGQALSYEFNGAHSLQVTALAIDSTNNFVVSGGDDGFVKIMNIPDREILKSIQAFTYKYGNPTISEIDFSNDGTLIYVGGFGDFSGIKTYSIPDDNQSSFAEIPDSKVFASSPEKGVFAVGIGKYYEVDSLIIYDYGTLARKKSFVIPEGFYIPPSNYKLSFSLNGGLLASSAPGTWQSTLLDENVIIWNTFTNEIKCSLDVHDPAINWLNFSQNGEVLVVGGISGVSLWNTEDCNLITKFNQHASIRDMTFFETENILSISQNGFLSVWNLPSNSIRQQWELPSDFTRVSFSPDGRKLALLTSDGVSVFSVENNELSKMYELTERLIFVDIGESNGITYLAYVTAITDTVTVIDIDSQDKIADFPYASGYASGSDLLNFSPTNGNLAIVGFQFKEIRNIRRGGKTEIIGCGYSTTRKLLFSDQETYLAEVCDDYKSHFIYLLNLSNGKTIWFAKLGKLIDTTALAFSSDEKILVSGDTNGMIYLWDVENGDKIAEWHAHYDPINSMLFSNDGTMLISSSEDGTIKVWGIP